MSDRAVRMVTGLGVIIGLALFWFCVALLLMTWFCGC